MIWLLVGVLLLAPSPRRGGHRAEAPAETLTDEEIAQRANAFLGSIDTPITDKQWKTLGPRAALVLEPIVEDENAMPSRRAKALYGLVFAAPDRAARLVGKLARDEGQPLVVRVEAVHGAYSVLPRSKVIAELRPVLETSRDAGLRGVAADVLSRVKGGCDAVRARARRESSDERAAYERALERCGE